MWVGSGGWPPVTRALLDPFIQEATRTLLRMQHMDFCLALMLGHMEQWSHRLSGGVLAGFFRRYVPWISLKYGTKSSKIFETDENRFTFTSSLRLHFGSHTAGWIGYSSPQNTYSFTLQPQEVITGVTIHHGNIQGNIPGDGVTEMVSGFTFHTNTGQ